MRSIFEIKKVFKPKEGDVFFSKKKNTESTEEQIQKQLNEKGFQNQLTEVIGKWPGDENFDELLNMLTK